MAADFAAGAGVEGLVAAGAELLEAGAGAGAAWGVELDAPAGAEAESDEVDFLDFEDLADFVEEEASPAGVEVAPLSDFFEVVEAEEPAPEASVESAFLVLDDFLAVAESAEALSAGSDVLDLEVDFLVVEASAGVWSAVSDFLDFAEDFLVEEASAESEGLDLDEDFLVEEAESAEASSVDFFFFLDFVVELESD